MALLSSLPCLFNMSLRPAAKRQRRPAINVYEDPDKVQATHDAISNKPTEVLIRHTNYDSNTRGLITSNTYVAVPGSATKVQSMLTPSEIAWNSIDDDVRISAGLIEIGDDFVDSETLPYDWMDPNYSHKITDVTDEAVRRRRTAATVRLSVYQVHIRGLIILLKDTPLLVWVDEIDVYLTELLRLEGRGDSYDQMGCAMCSKLASALYRCERCFDTRLVCVACLIACHQSKPFHCVEVNYIIYVVCILAVIDTRHLAMVE
jgi:hypothetical protein